MEALVPVSPDLAPGPAHPFRRRGPRGQGLCPQKTAYLEGRNEVPLPRRSPLRPGSGPGGSQHRVRTSPPCGRRPRAAPLAQHPRVSSNFPRPRLVLPLAPQRVPQLHPHGRASLRVPDHRKPVHCPHQRLRPGQLLLPGHQPHGLLHQECLQQVRSAQPGCRRSGSAGTVGRREPRASEHWGKRLCPWRL